jgi:hypothetical protein
MQWLGLILLTIGSVIALIAATPLPTAGAWLPATWPLYGLGLMLALSGLLLQRVAQRHVRLIEATTAATPLLHSLLPTFILAVEALPKHWADPGLIAQLERLHSEYLSPLVEQRHQLYGYSGHAQATACLLALAYGERLFNRLWSAAGDGCLDEVRAVYPPMLAAFKQAQVLADK